MAAEVQFLRQPEEDLVDVLESLLTKAKSGELRAFCYASVEPGSNIGTGWALAPDCNLYEVTASIDILHHRFVRDMTDADDRDEY